MSATIIAVLNRKGGVGKTTTTEVLAYYLYTAFDKRVLLVDSDSQANLTTGQGYDWQELEGVGETLGHVLLGKTEIQGAIQKPHSRLHLLPASDDLKNTEKELVRSNAPVTKLRELLEELRPLYDYILIDGPPAFSHITESAMAAGGLPVNRHSASG